MFQVISVFVGQPQRALAVVLVFRWELTGVFYVCTSVFEPSSEFVISMDVFQQLGVR